MRTCGAVQASGRLADCMGETTFLSCLPIRYVCYVNIAGCTSGLHLHLHLVSIRLDELNCMFACLPLHLPCPARVCDVVHLQINGWLARLTPRERYL